jgi:hypothetical protein
LIDKQPSAHPIPLFDESSHVSGLITFPSPQTVTQFDGVLMSPPVQLHPSTFPVQSPRHLSALLVSPSSQVSPTFTFPFPHIRLHTLGVVGFPAVGHS